MNAAYEKGVDAYLSGVDVDENPYCHWDEAELYNEWHRGFVNAKWESYQENV